MARPTKAAIEERRGRVAQLYKGGATQTQIAKSLGVSDATVSSDLAIITQGWRATQQASIADAGFRLRPRNQGRPHPTLPRMRGGQIERPSRLTGEGKVGALGKGGTGPAGPRCSAVQAIFPTHPVA